MSDSIILDSSALLALIQEERGGDIVKPLVKFAVMSTINIAETLTVLKRNDLHFQDTLTLIQDFVPTIIPFDLSQAAKVAELESLTKHKGLSLGDRACIALGMQMQLPIYTADKIWAQLQLDNVTIKIIRD